jgi:hypothetical protein
MNAAVRSNRVPARNWPITRKVLLPSLLPTTIAASSDIAMLPGNQVALPCMLRSSITATMWP